MTRHDLRNKGESTLIALFGSSKQAPGFGNLQTEAVFGNIWNRAGLPLDMRALCTIAALATFPRLGPLRHYLRASLTLGWSAEGLREILVQSSLYAGFAAAEDTLLVLADVLAECNVPAPSLPPEDVTPVELMQRGTALMHTLHDDRAQVGYAAPGNAVTAPLYEIAIQYGYGEIWHRPGLEVGPRTLVAVASFTALRLPEQVKKFGLSALNVGMSETEVIEAIIQTAPYSGFLPALNALTSLAAAFKDRGK
jgi:4-carboxymuconolactone decarboxylase